MSFIIGQHFVTGASHDNLADRSIIATITWYKSQRDNWKTGWMSC